MARVVYHSGEFVPEREARISIFDSALMYGDMAFEMTRTFAGRPFRLREHIARLYRSLRMLEIDCGLSMGAMEQLSLEVLARNVDTETADVDWQIMHNVSRGPLQLYRTAFGGELRPTVTISSWPLITHMGRFAPHYRNGVRLAIPAQQSLPAHLLDPKAKTRSRVHYRLAELQAARIDGGSWAVLVDADGFLTEGSGWNLFLVKNGVLHTPEPRNLLQGVSRSVTMEIAGGLGIEVRERDLGRYEALDADEIFCTATSFCLVHAVTFESQTVGAGRPGPVFRALKNAWMEATGVDHVRQAEDYARRLVDWEEAQLQLVDGGVGRS